MEEQRSPPGPWAGGLRSPPRKVGTANMGRMWPRGSASGEARAAQADEALHSHSVQAALVLLAGGPGLCNNTLTQMPNSLLH